MIDVAITGLSLLLSALIMPHDKKTPWTPTFEGTRQERFIQAMHHYQEKMGNEDQLVFTVVATHPDFDAWVMPSPRGEAHVGWAEDNGREWRNRRLANKSLTVKKRHIKVWKPELIALHESCHLRMQHHREMPPMAHIEVNRCMGWYSEEWRR